MTVSFPSELEIVVSRGFQAPIDLRVGGNYRFVFVPEDGGECAFRGAYLELQRPTRISNTWLFEGWPDAEAVETFDLAEGEGDGATTVTWTLAFRDQAGRDHMSKVDGIEGNFDNLDRYLASLVRPEGQ